MIERISIAKFLEQTPEQQNLAWWDWFCKDSSLPAKTVNLVAKLRSIADSKLFDNSKTYVFFKNNCPMDGSLYDSFSICDIETGDVLFWVSPSLGYTARKGKAEVADIVNGTEVLGNWADVEKFFLD